MPMKEKLKYFLITFGERSVTMDGISMMLMLYAGCLDILMHWQLDHLLTTEKEVVPFGWIMLGAPVWRAA